MSFSNFEYPNTNFYNSDLRELIAMYKKLTAEYDYLKDTIDILKIDNQDIRKELLRIENMMKSLESTILTDVQKVLDSTVEQLKEDNKVILEEFNSSISVINKEMDSLTKYVSNSIYSMGKKIELSETKITKYSDTNDDKLYTYINKECARIEKEISGIKIYKGDLIDPVDEKQKPIQDTIYDIYYNLKSWALRAYSYDKLELTADEYDKSGLTAWNYDYLSKWYIREKTKIENKVIKIINGINDRIDYVIKLIDERTKAFSPLSGKVISLKDLVYGFTEILRTDAITAAEYGAIELTAEDYENRGLTAYVYDWYGKPFLTSVTTSLTALEYELLGLTADDYDMLQLTAIQYDMYGIH